MVGQRGVSVDLSTIYDSVQGFTTRFIDAARADRSPTSSRRRVDEPYLKINGSWHDVYRAIDEHSQIVDVYLSDRRNAEVKDDHPDLMDRLAVNSNSANRSTVPLGQVG